MYIFFRNNSWIKFEPETAERFSCESGEVYRIEAFQELLDLGLDHNHAHVKPTGAYHYHGVPTELVELLDQGEDIIHIGITLDGLPQSIILTVAATTRVYRLTDKMGTGDVCSYLLGGVYFNK